MKGNQVVRKDVWENLMIGRDGHAVLGGEPRYEYLNS